MQQKLEFYGWEQEASVFGEAAAFGHPGCLLDMTVTELAQGGAEFDVVEGVEVVHRGHAETVEAAKREAEALARRRFFRTV